jgi:Glycosyltransferase 61
MAQPGQKSASRVNARRTWLSGPFWPGFLRRMARQAQGWFPTRSITAVVGAERVLHDSVQFHSASFDPALHGDIVRRAALNDAMLGLSGAPRSGLFRRQVAIVPNCTVFAHDGAVRAARGALIEVHEREIPPRSSAAPKRLTTRMFQHGLVTWLDGTQDYFRLFASLLPLIGYLQREHRPDRPLTVLVPANGPRFQQQICAAIEASYRGVRFEGLEIGERAEVRQYLWLYHGSENTEWLPIDAKGGAALARLLWRHYGMDPPRGRERLFVSQSVLKQPRLINLPELEEIAAARGFQCFEAHDGNHEEQLRRFGEADIIVAVHGPALANLMFARPGTTVLELFPETGVKSRFLWLATRMGLNYRALLGSADAKQAFHFAPGRFAEALRDAMQARDLAASPWRLGLPPQASA